MRIKNKNAFDNSSQSWRSVSRVNALKAYVEASKKQNIDFDEIRASVPVLADYPDGHLHQLAIDIGYDVIT